MLLTIWCLWNMNMSCLEYNDWRDWKFLIACTIFTLLPNTLSKSKLLSRPKSLFPNSSMNVFLSLSGYLNMVLNSGCLWNMNSCLANWVWHGGFHLLIECISNCWWPNLKESISSLFFSTFFQLFNVLWNKKNSSYFSQNPWQLSQLKNVPCYGNHN